jgi:hypothetical protein
VKALWISVLEATRQQRPIPFPHHADLATYSVQELRDGAGHYLRFNTNWDREHPQLVKQIEKIPFRPQAKIVSLVPGAGIVVLYESPNLVCFDALKGLKSERLFVGQKCFRISRAYFEEPGECLVAVAAGDDE